ncbi:MAG: gamma-glutamyltransferase family protein [Gemmatimonadaceae bacterium]
MPYVSPRTAPLRRARPTRGAAARTASLLLLTVLACRPAVNPSPTAIAAMSGKRAEGAQGMVAASQPDAAAAGVEILRAGGNAADAAVAAAFALSVTDVSQTGLGGGGALTFYDAAEGRAEHLSFYPRTGADSLWGVPDTTPAGRRAGRAAAVPGMVAGLLETHRRFGVLPLARVMAPAIRLARDGFVVTPLLARTIASSRAKLLEDPAAAARFLPGGESLLPGERLVQPELAATLERIASEGRDAFYRGGVADRLSAAVRARGGLITVRDVEAYTLTTPSPVCIPWRGLTVLSAPPPTGGVPVVQMLTMAEAVGLTRADGFTEHGDAVATMAGIIRVANADAAWHGDPNVMPVPIRGLASATYARLRASGVAGAAADTVRAGDPWAFEADAMPSACAAYPTPVATRPAASAPAEPEPDATDPLATYAGSNTSHLAVVDAAGNAVSATTTVGVLFGSGVYTSGFFLNSSGANLTARTRGPNRFTNSTIAPTLVLDGRAVRLVVGAAGSQYIQPAVAQVTLRMLAFGEDPATALAGPRILSSPTRREVEVEPGFGSEVYATLIARGYRPVSRVADIQFGGVHAILVRPDGRRIGAADPRRDGAAIAQ